MSFSNLFGSGGTGTIANVPSGKVRLTISKQKDSKVAGGSRYYIVHAFNAQDLLSYGFKSGDKVNIQIDSSSRNARLVIDSDTGRTMGGMHTVSVRTVWKPYRPCVVDAVLCDIIKTEEDPGRLYFKYTDDVSFDRINIFEAAAKVKEFRPVGEL